ncbi:porin [Chitinilyticum aquatile]|uniref:porin n=1 Tax=Chitinilyticum aquatile TaxID=362520 RepID=UPI0003F4BF9C|nr:porin [Chitinilyticum aquatile]
MQKIIAAAIAAAFLAPVAMAEVTIGGSIRTSVDYVDLKGATATTIADSHAQRVADQSSRIYVQGTDKLDGGGKLVWRLESGVMVGGVGGGSASGLWGSREAWIGYQEDSLGNLRFGKMDNAYKNAAKSFIPAIDGYFNDDSGWQGGSQILRRLGGRSGEQINYISPNWSGVQIQGSYDLGAYNTANTGHTDNFDAALTYKADMFALGAVYGYANDRKISFGSVDIGTGTSNTALGTSIQGYQLGGSFFWGKDFSLSAVYENVEWDDGKISRDQDSFGVAAMYKMDKFTFHGGYVWAGDVSGLADTGADQFSIGARYNLSKQSSINLSYTNLKNDRNAKFKSEAPGVSIAAGQDQQVFTLGFRNDF